MACPSIIDPATKERLPRVPVLDLLADASNETAAHYSKQWGDDTGYTKFIRNAPTAAKHTMARQLGWPDLFNRIRAEATIRDVSVYDAPADLGSFIAICTRRRRPIICLTSALIFTRLWDQ